MFRVGSDLIYGYLWYINCHEFSLFSARSGRCKEYLLSIVSSDGQIS